MSISQSDLDRLRANLAKAREGRQEAPGRLGGQVEPSKRASVAAKALPVRSGKPRFTRSKPEDRTWQGTTYASKVEMRFAHELERERRATPGMFWLRQPVFDLAGAKYSPDFIVVRPRAVSCGVDQPPATLLGAFTVTVYEIKPRGLSPRFRAEALRTFRRNQKQVRALWGVEILLVEM